MTRITQKAINRSYFAGYNSNLKAYNDSVNKMNTGREFSKVSEDVSAAARTYKVRKALARNNQYIENISDIENRVEAAEDALTNINSYIQTLQERLVQAHGAVTDDERKIIGTEIENLMNNVLQSINESNTGRYVFGSNENKAPFTVNENGEVVYHDGTLVSQITDRFNHETDVYADIGAGMKFVNGELEETTTTKTSFSGLECLGFGTREFEGETYPNNIIEIFKQAKDVILSGDTEQLGKFENFVNARYKEYVVNLTNVGNISSYLADCKERIEDENMNLTERQNDLEAVDYAEESIFSQTFYMAYQISVQMGSKILPNSIFSFIN